MMDEKNKDLADTFLYPAVAVEDVADSISELNQTDIINFIMHIDSNLMDSSFTYDLIDALKRSLDPELKGISCGPHDKYYANKSQTEDWDALVAEAEAGSHEWVRENTLFVCGIYNKDIYGCNECPYIGPIRHNKTFGGYTCYKRLPYRGDKSEEVTWPGMGGKTHTEALKEIAAKEKASSGRTGEDCSDVENRKPELFSGTPSEYLEFIKNYDKHQDVLKEESEMENVEYVVKDFFSTSVLSESDFDPVLFKEYYKEFGDDDGVNYENGIIIGGKGYSYDIFIPELLSLGFIEEKVCDPVVNQGDSFKNKHWVCSVCQVSPGKYQLINIGGCNREENTIVSANNGPIKLSDFVGKDRLSEFKPVKVEIRVVD